MLPHPTGLMYKETIAAFAANCKVLAGVGCRAVIEAVCIGKQIIGRNLESQINALSKKGLITRVESDRLHSIRFIGNNSVHEMKALKDEQLNLVLHIIEHLLLNLYLIDAEARNKLEVIINDYKDFKKSLFKLKTSLNAGDEFCIIKLFAKEFRRINDGFTAFETELIKDIQSGQLNSIKVNCSWCSET